MVIQSVIIFHRFDMIMSLVLAVNNQIYVNVVLRVGRGVGSRMRARPCS
jgi:hypothetical protein